MLGCLGGGIFGAYCSRWAWPGKEDQLPPVGCGVPQDWGGNCVRACDCCGTYIGCWKGLLGPQRSTYMPDRAFQRRIFSDICKV